MPDEARLVAIADRLERPGFAAVPSFLGDGQVAALRQLALARHAAGAFRRAAIGTGERRQVRDDLRGDEILWMPPEPTGPERALLDVLESLRLTLNRELALGLFELECHYALYPPGKAYARHLDRFATGASRVVSCILYLNEGWTAADGGMLRLYADEEVVDVLPEGGTLVAFLSERFWHEVLPATRPRLSLTGWFRRRA